MIRLTLMSSLFALAASPVVAEEIRQLDAHVHGEGMLTIAVEGNTLAMELESPAMDIVGFEHEASTDEQRAAVEAARDTLSSPLEVFVLPERAGCTVISASVEHLFGDEHEDEGEEREDHAVRDDHDEPGDHPEEMAQGEHEEHGGESGHSEFLASYELSCAEPGAINAMDLRFFQLFPGAQSLDVQIVTDRGQKAFEVERDDPRITFGELLG